MNDRIRIQGARQHNLKNISLELPRNRFIVVTGLSGSGKSSLAFDTLYAEGQRRYVESLSTYARQFLERMEKPDVDLIEGLSPAISIEQKTAGHNPRSTVGTVTEIYDYLRLLFARVGRPHCHQCQAPISSQSLDQIMDQILALPEKTRLLILAPLVSGQKGTHEKLFANLRREGFARVRLNGELRELADLPPLPRNRKHTIDVLVDRLVMKPNIRNRLADSVELALSYSGGSVKISVPDGEELLFSETAACARCGISYPEFTPASFSFNSPQGACTACDGLGITTELDPRLIIPDPSLSLREGVILPWANRNSPWFGDFLDTLVRHYRTDIYTPYEKLPQTFQKVLLYGSGEEEITFFYERGKKRRAYAKPFEGVIPWLRRRYLETDSRHSRDEIEQYMNFLPCAACKGARLNPGAAAVRVGGQEISRITAFSVAAAHSFFESLPKQLGEKDMAIARRILKEISERLGFLKNVGLSYLSLDRGANTLSGGESQRIRLATQIGSRLTGVLYVLDEPSIGLHQRDNERLLSTLLQMRDIGNTVLVVEHDEETMRRSDHIVDMGPGAGMKGGEVVFSGPPNDLLTHPDSLTGKYLSGRMGIPVPATRRTGNGKAVMVREASANNLRKATARFPLGCFICVTGVSGSGKSTLVLETLHKALARQLHRRHISHGECRGIEGIRFVDKVVHIDQSPIGRTPRSNPGTYTGAFTHIRELFAQTPEARMRGYKPGRFSFNVKGGRCEACQGDGVLKIEMHFLPDIYVTCDVCGGSRYNRETLDIQYKGEKIDDILQMTVNRASVFFASVPVIRMRLSTLVDVGLGYVRLGQPATTLSGGEAQRVKLARELSKRATGKTVYILDEPTTGLHMDDVRKLLDVLNRLVDKGNTVIVIEHNLDVIKSADHIIDLGPEGGDGGGRIIAEGTPEEVALSAVSHTGRFLARELKKSK